MKKTELKIFLIVWVILSILFFDISKLDASFYNWYENTPDLLLKAGSEEEEEEDEEFILPYYIKEIGIHQDMPSKPLIYSLSPFYELDCIADIFPIGLENNLEKISLGFASLQNEEVPLELVYYDDEKKQEKIEELEENSEPYALVTLYTYYLRTTYNR